MLKWTWVSTIRTFAWGLLQNNSFWGRYTPKGESTVSRIFCLPWQLMSALKDNDLFPWEEILSFVSEGMRCRGEEQSLQQVLWILTFQYFTTKMQREKISYFQRKVFQQPKIMTWTNMNKYEKCIKPSYIVAHYLVPQKKILEGFYRILYGHEGYLGYLTRTIWTNNYMDTSGEIWLLLAQGLQGDIVWICQWQKTGWLMTDYPQWTITVTHVECFTSMS